MARMALVVFPLRVHYARVASAEALGGIGMLSPDSVHPRRFRGWSRASSKSRYFGRGGIVGRVRGTAGRSQMLAQSARTEKRASKALDCQAK